MRAKTLPTYYYLDHFREFLDYIHGPCLSLLSESQCKWIEQWHALDQPKQCIVARVANRKHSLIATKSLAYDEIPDWQKHSKEMIGESWIRPIETQDFNSILPLLTKPELLHLLRFDGSVTVKSTQPKAAIVELAVNQLAFTSFQQSDLYRQYVVRSFDANLNYFLFLFFGHLRGTLSQFSMRDLGVMRTRKDSPNSTARFTAKAEAQSAFEYAKLRHQLRNNLAPQLSLSELPEAIGALANKYKDECLWLVGKAYLPTDYSYAMAALALSNNSQAQEKWIREAYKKGDKELVETKLGQLIDDPPSEELAVFAEDFLARKYRQKRTSRLTDMLNNAQVNLSIDSQYINQVENGVVDYYGRKGITAVRTENSLWLSLFGLVFWDIIYDKDDRGLTNEFDIRPNVLVENRLYLDHANAVEQRLKQFSSPEIMIDFLLTQVSRHHGKITNLLHWHAHLLDNLILLLRHSPMQNCIAMLRIMSKDFQSFKDGFPDIMVIENNQLRFEEIKAPGDQIRRNQLISLTKLQAVGYQVKITRVEWFRDPMQPYVVVDVETTGGRAGSHRITEIGMVKRVNGETVAEWQSLINPQRHIPSHITSLTGIDDHMVANAPSFAEVADSIEEFTQGCVFVAHNVNFDYGFFKHEFERLDRFYRRPKVCTVREMRRFFPGLKSYSLANLTAHFNIQMERHHRALSDAVAAAELLQLTHSYTEV